MNKVFVYDELLSLEIRELLNLHPTNEVMGEAEGKMYIIHKMPIVLLPNEITKERGNRRILGAILEFPKSGIEKVLDVIDNFKGCSMSRSGVKNPLDLTYRTISTVYPIQFDNIHELATYRYKYSEPIECWMYFGNTKHTDILRCVRSNQNYKVTEGVYKKGLQDALQRLKYI